MNFAYGDLHSRRKIELGPLPEKGGDRAYPLAQVAQEFSIAPYSTHQGTDHLRLRHMFSFIKADIFPRFGAYPRANGVAQTIRIRGALTSFRGGNLEAMLAQPLEQGLVSS